MTDINRSLIAEYIVEYKGSADLMSAYRAFNRSWLDEFDDTSTKHVITELDCVKWERLYGDGEYSERVLDDFIVSLEEILTT